MFELAQAKQKADALRAWVASAVECKASRPSDSQHGACQLQWNRQAIHHWCQGLVDTKISKYLQSKGKSDSDKSSSKSQSQSRKDDMTRKLYDNCPMLAPDGTFIAFINNKKVDWYLKRDLATLESPPQNSNDGATDAVTDPSTSVSASASSSSASSSEEQLSHSQKKQQPRTIRLKFEPHGYGNSSRAGTDEKAQNFYLSEFSNHCVVCGETHGFRRHNVVPSSYRKHFPPVFKIYSNHDVVLLCPNCHRQAEQYDIQFAEELAREYGVVLPGSQEHKELCDPVKLSVNKAAIVLRNTAARKLKLPSKRLNELRETIAAYLNKSADMLTNADVAAALLIDPCDANDEVLNMAMKLNEEMARGGDKSAIAAKRRAQLREHNANSSPQLRIVSQLTDDQLQNFIVRWRRHFVDRMAPRHLSPFWDVEHRSHLRSSADQDALNHIEEDELDCSDDNEHLFDEDDGLDFLNTGEVLVAANDESNPLPSDAVLYIPHTPTTPGFSMVRGKPILFRPSRSRPGQFHSYHSKSGRHDAWQYTLYESKPTDQPDALVLPPGRYTMTCVGVVNRNHARVRWYLDDEPLNRGQRQEWYAPRIKYGVYKSIRDVVIGAGSEAAGASNADKQELKQSSNLEATAADFESPNSLPVTQPRSHVLRCESVGHHPHSTGFIVCLAHIYFTRQED